MEVDILIDKLKARYSERTDQGLAKAMGLSRSTVANWRNRGSIPERYARLANSDITRKFYGELAWENWNELEKVGMQLAFLRLFRDYQMKLQDYDRFLTISYTLPARLPEYHAQACSDIADIMAREDINEQLALHIVAFAEFKK